MRIVEGSIRQPITVAVGVILALLIGYVAAVRIPVRMTPEVDSVVIAATTFWENASPEEIETDVIEPQEQKLGNLAGLVSMASMCQAGQGQIRLEFRTGTDIRAALAEVDRKLGEVPSYPVGVDKPQIVDIDPESVDFIAWIGLATTDPDFDPTTLYDFMERRLKPRLESIPGISEVNIYGAREREVQIRIDPMRLAERGLTWAALVDAIRASNDDFSGGKIPDGKNDVRVRATGRFADVDEVKDMVVRRGNDGPVYLRDVANVTATHKEVTGWVRTRGHRMPFLSMQLETGGNLLDTMAEAQAEMARLNAPGGVLEQEARRLGLDGTLELVQTFDASTYVTDALELVRSNVIAGAILAVITLLLFLRSLRTIGIIGAAIPISVIPALAVLAGLGRTFNIISLAGIAFATGMVVDNAIVVIENIFRHLEMGKSVKRASLDGSKEVVGAVVAATLTTLVVFLPILLIEEAAGQLFRDIALAIMAAIGCSLIVSLTVVPSAASLILRPRKARAERTRPSGPLRRAFAAVGAFLRVVGNLPGHAAAIVRFITGGWIRRILVILVLSAGTVYGIARLIPPLDYLPQGNRNIVFGLLIPPPGYNLDQLLAVGQRIEERIKPFWEAGGESFGIEKRLRGDAPPPADTRAPLPPMPGVPDNLIPPPLEHYFLVGFDGRVFHGGIAAVKDRAVDVVPLMQYASGPDVAPDIYSFAFQMPLFRSGGTTGSAIKIDLIGDNLDAVTASAAALMFSLVQDFGPYTVTPEPSNFLLPTPELRVTPNDERLRDLGMSRRDVGYAVQASGDGILLPRQFKVEGELKDLRLITHAAQRASPVVALTREPVATPEGRVVDLESIATVERITVPDRIKRVNRQRAVTLQFTPPVGMPLGDAILAIEAKAEDLRTNGAVAPGVEIVLAGSAGALAEIKNALLGDGTFKGTLLSSLALAALVVYLLMVVLFQSWLHPLIIMMTVPLATLGGFAGLAMVHQWSINDRYIPIQNLDVLTILGFVILAGIVTNNAILIIHQALQFLAGGMASPREAVIESVRSRVRPILMSTLTSVGGMAPLVLVPGSGSELYRGLGAVVTGGLLVATLFTIFLVPVLFDVAMRIVPSRTPDPEDEAARRGSFA